MSRQEWETLLGAAPSQLETQCPQTSVSYPLLGQEQSSPPPNSPKSWQIRVVIRDDIESKSLAALSQGVEEILKLGSAPEPGQGKKLPSCLPCTLSPEGTARVTADLKLLRNLAEIARLREAHPEVKEWTLVSSGETGDDPEKFVPETIRILTGVLAGCDAVELWQAEGEGFNSLWTRLNIARLLRSESELEASPDLLSGAGFFQELQKRLVQN